jgi:membrane associated rhomboid family serine protease
MKNFKEIKNVPLSAFIAVSIIVIFSLYTTTLIKTIPCGKDLLSVFYSNFVHLELYHLIGNVIGLYVLSRVEEEIGAKKFAILISFLLIFNTIVESSIHKIFPNTTCTIGFSGVIFGILTWELITTKQIDFLAILSLLSMILLPISHTSNVSLSSHIIGSIGGIFSGIVWSIIYQQH